ncbi:hypothetical protein LINPERHAP2_LOCUS35849 [Linum perenne]
MPIFSTTFFKDFSPCFESLSTFLAQTPSVLLENSFTSYFSTFSSLSNPSPLLFNQPSVLCPEPFFSPFPNLSNFLPSSEFGSSLGPLTDSEEQDLQLKTKEVSHLIGLSLNGSTEEADKFISNSILHSMTHKRRSSRRSKLQMERRILGLPDIPENDSTGLFLCTLSFEVVLPKNMLERPTLGIAFPLRIIWISWAPPRSCFFLWLSSLNVLSTCDNLQRRGFSSQIDALYAQKQKKTLTIFFFFAHILLEFGVTFWMYTAGIL